MVNTVLQYLRKNDVMSQSAALDDVPETYEEPDASAVDTIPQKVLMQFISELPAGYRTSCEADDFSLIPSNRAISL